MSKHWYKDKNLIALSSAFFLANIGWGMAWPYLPVYMVFIGGSLLAVGLLSITYNIFASIFQYPWGRLSDRYQNKKIFIAAGLMGSGIFYYLISMTLIPVIILGYRTMQGMITSMSTPTASALIVEIAGAHTGMYFGIFNSFAQLGYTIGGMLGGTIVYTFHSIALVFIFATIALVMAAVVALIFIKEKKVPIDRSKIPFPFFRTEGKPGRMPLNIKDALNIWKNNKKMGIIFLVVLFVMTGSGEVYSLLPIYFAKFGEEWVGILYGVEAISVTVSMPIAGILVERVGKKKTLMLGIIGYIITYVLYSIMPTPQLMIIAEIVSGIKWSAFLVAGSAYVASIASRDKMARSQAVLNTAQTGGWVIGPMIGIFIAFMFSLIINFYIAMAFMIIGIILLLLFVVEPISEHL